MVGIAATRRTGSSPLPSDLFEALLPLPPEFPPHPARDTIAADASKSATPFFNFIITFLLKIMHPLCICFVVFIIAGGTFFVFWIFLLFFIVKLVYFFIFTFHSLFRLFQSLICRKYINRILYFCALLFLCLK